VAVKTDILPPRYRGPVRIGHGAMGDIYRATDETLGRDVAIKVLAERYAQDTSVRHRFTREALAAARLSGQPNAVTIFDVGEWGGRPFIVMEHLPGGSLEDVVRERGPQEPGQAWAWLEQTAEALDAAHAQGVVHRDVKPANLLLDGEGNVHVADFGIASATGLDSMTATGTVLGTAGYLSPEQAQGERATAASDRYALAVVAFELLTGRRPFEGDTPTAEASAHVHAPVPSITGVRRDLPRELDAVFARALAKDPAARFPTCAEFVAALRESLYDAAGTTSVLAAAPPTPTPARRSSLRPAVLALIAAGLLVGGVAIAAALTSGGGDEPTPAPKARTVVRTVTTAGEPVTVTQRVTTAAAPSSSGPSPGSGGGGSLAEGRRLNDQAFALMSRGDFAGALPLAQQALERLRGSGDPYEAFAEYNLGRSLIELGRCGQGLPHIDRSEQLQGHRSEFDDARAKCEEGG
jgi:eukaryotic-like serine/threonine-protein kinase